MKKLADKIYVCAFCSTVRKTEQGILTHEAKCTKNITKITKEQITLQRHKDAVEDIRCTSKTVQELITRMQEFWLTFGIKVTFTSYPENFLLMLSNSHNAPKGYKTNWCNQDKSSPKGYPGWSGHWKGNVELVDVKTFSKIHGKSNVGFSDLTRSSWGDLPLITKAEFFQSGSGGGGDNFSYGGYLFLYDFPAMHDEFKCNGGEYDVLDKNYNQALKDYEEVYNKAVNNFVNDDKEFNKLTSIIKELSNVMIDLEKAKTKLSSKLKNDFNEKYNTKMPIQKSAFSECENTMKTQCAIDYKIKLDHPDLNKMLSYAGMLKDKIDVYKMDNPEFFI